MKPTDIAAFLRDKTPLFQQFSAAQIEAIVGGARLVSFERHEAIVEFGEEGRFLGVLLEGEAEASVTDDSGQVHRLGLLEPGAVFGEMSLLTGAKTTADVVGLGPCLALLIPHQVVATTVVTHLPAIKHLGRVMAERLRMAAESAAASAPPAASARTAVDAYGLRLSSAEPMKLLAISCGASALKYALFDTADESRNVRGVVERIGRSGPMRLAQTSAGGKVERELPAGDHGAAFAAVLEALRAAGAGGIASLAEIGAVGHRVAHGGDRFTGPALITAEVLDAIASLAALAPLHEPGSLLGITAARRLLSGVPHVAVFDTSFHHTLPAYAYLYGLPSEYSEQEHIRRYGFHGTSHAYVALRAAEFLKRPYNELEIVSCHLGNGASVCAIDHGRSVDTSMGFTPAEGLIMSTRCGSIDPAILIHLMRTQGLGADDLDRLINTQSGLKGLSGISPDMREIERAAADGNRRALLATKVFSYQVRKSIGSYAAAMGGIDALIFTGGIGRGSAGVRSLACQGLEFMGIAIDEGRNREAAGFERVTDIARADAPIRVLVVPTDEERMVARETLRVLESRYINAIIRKRHDTPIPIEVSAHHVHLSQPHVEALFGAGHQLSPESDLSQPGQFACREQVTLVGPKGRVQRVRVLGPARKETQIEIAMTEQFTLGIQPPIRESGDLKNTPGVTLEGPAGSITVDHGVICALRHIHMSPEDALGFGLRDKHVVQVRVSGERELTFGDVLIRVHPDFRLAMHIDTDEANAANIRGGMVGTIAEISLRG